MAKSSPSKIKWLADVQEHDYAAAESYLSLLYRGKDVVKMVSKLRDTSVVRFKAKDIFRASQLPLLGITNSHVEKDHVKIQRGQSLSPLLLVRDSTLGRVIIADGYHRLCAVYGFDEDAWIRCRIA